MWFYEAVRISESNFVETANKLSLFTKAIMPGK